MKILYPLMGEKATNLREFNNVLSFVVENNATKEEIKKEVEEEYNIKVEKVNTMIVKGIKKSHVKLKREYSAMDIASKFGTI